jgi:hypothetical protein
MNETGINALYLGLLLILPISALAARRLPIAQTFKLALAWLAIFGVMFLLVMLWQYAFGSVGSVGGVK